MRRAAVTLAEAQSFDRVAGTYDRLGDLNPNELTDSWLEGLLPAAGGRALDIGCGTGRHATLPAGRFEQVDAIDLSGPMIDLARTLRPRLHALAVQKLSVNLVRRGPSTAWEIYRLATRRQWLDHRVTDRFFSRDELERSYRACSLATASTSWAGRAV